VIGCTFEGNAGGQHTTQRDGQRRTCGIDDSGVIEPGRARRRWRATQALPRVQRGVMVVTTGGEKTPGNRRGAA
jgi:hypothetical protein